MNHLTKVVVSIKYETEVSKAGETLISGAGPKPATAKQTLLDAIDELARLAEIDGYGQEAADAVAAARGRVQDWRSKNP